MASRSVEFHPRAHDELVAAFRWYQERSPTAAEAFRGEIERGIERAIERIAVSPRRWPVHAHHTRRFLLRSFPFGVIFRETPAGVQVFAIAHGRRAPGYWQPRLDPGAEGGSGP